MKRLVLWVPLIVFAVFLAVVAIGLYAPSDRQIPSQLVGRPMPEFALAPAVQGRPGLSTAGYRQGQARLVNVFASWCIPCRAEAVQLEELARRGIPIDGVAVRDRPQDLAGFLATYGDPFRAIGADNDRRVQLALVVRELLKSPDPGTRAHDRDQVAVLHLIIDEFSQRLSDPYHALVGKV